MTLPWYQTPYNPDSDLQAPYASQRTVINNPKSILARLKQQSKDFSQPHSLKQRFAEKKKFSK